MVTQFMRYIEYRITWSYDSLFVLYMLDGLLGSCSFEIFEGTADLGLVSPSLRFEV